MNLHGIFDASLASVEFLCSPDEDGYSVADVPWTGLEVSSTKMFSLESLTVFDTIPFGPVFQSTWKIVSQWVDFVYQKQ